MHEQHNKLVIWRKLKLIFDAVVQSFSAKTNNRAALRAHYIATGLLHSPLLGD